MSSSWIRTALKYGLLLTPAAALAGLVLLVAAGAWVTAILRDPALFPDAPEFIQKLTRSVYWHTRTHWQMVRECAQFDAELLYRPRPGSCEFRNSEFVTRMNFDAQGTRLTPEPAAHKDGPSRPRLVVIGDSHAMGWGVEDHETFAGVLASEFGYRTVNLAVSSYATPRELRRLERDFTLAKDDVLVIQYSENDLVENLGFLRHRQVGPYHPEELEAMQSHEPTPVRALPVAGVALRRLWRGAAMRLAGMAFDAERAAPSRDATTAFLGVLEAFSLPQGQNIIVLEIDPPGQAPRLSRNALAARQIRLVAPRVSRDEFYSIDDHMRSIGHRAVAVQIAAELSKLHP